ncbi:hypothetical protein E0I26_15000 [Flavobacterium rhamnosiphilum]|uniref:Lipocalin-like domain-containing protein n=1 Tax=Flavobacterium rhamnosiphilum TaxID=2541724 RepID=A0A4R5F339_9FLAO|nr:hypothetical protein [Flavobacterium rhamnosiphilum]TDE42022.1 hypothetical protein E0I26_15000 [Flavobacterium rhamnosiphilum]
MKNLVILVAFLSVFSSCSKDDAVTMDSTGYYGKWTLVSMSGSIPNSETTGAAMEWQEFYLFNTNGTFTKSRERNLVKTSISGTYTTTTQSDGIYFELTYPNDSELIGNCYGNLKEVLYLTVNNSLSSTWKSCDGPGLEYKK